MSDGTALGTVLVKDINLGAVSGFPSISPAKRFTVVGSTLYFPASDGVNGVELWKSDGTAAGTVSVLNLNPGNLNGLAKVISR